MKKNQVEIPIKEMKEQQLNIQATAGDGSLTAGRKTPAFSQVSIQDAMKEEEEETQQLSAGSVKSFFHGSSGLLLLQLLILLLGLMLAIFCGLLLNDYFYTAMEKMFGIYAYPFMRERLSHEQPLLQSIELMRWLGFLGLAIGSYLISSRAIDLFPKLVALFLEIPESIKTEIVHFYKLSTHFSIAVALGVLTVQASRNFANRTYESGLPILERSYEFIVTASIMFLCLFQVLRYLRKLAMQRIAINYHNFHYRDRVAENNAKVGVLTQLKKYVLECVPFEPHLFDGLKLADTLAVFSNIKDARNGGEASGVSTASMDASRLLEIEHGAKDLAKAIVKALRPAAREKNVSLTAEDFALVFQSDAAPTAFSMLDSDGNGDLTLKELRMAIVETYQQRLAILKGLSENEAIVDQLENIVCVGNYLANVYLFMNVFDYNISSIVSLVTLITGFTWVFSGIVMSVFTSIIFIFITHPFDVGDRIIVDDKELTVADISLLTSSFVEPSGDLMYFRNSELVGKKIKNLRRSGAQAETVKFSIDAEPSKLEKMHQLETKLRAFFEGNARDFTIPESFFFFEIKDLKTLDVSIRVEHKGNFQDVALRAARRRRIAEFFAESVKSLGL